MTKREREAFEALWEAAESAAMWLCDTPPGTDQRNRGEKLRAALAQAEALKREGRNDAAPEVD